MFWNTGQQFTHILPEISILDEITFGISLNINSTLNSWLIIAGCKMFMRFCHSFIFFFILKLLSRASLLFPADALCGSGQILRVLGANIQATGIMSRGVKEPHTPLSCSLSVLRNFLMTAQYPSTWAKATIPQQARKSFGIHCGFSSGDPSQRFKPWQNAFYKILELQFFQCLFDSESFKITKNHTYKLVFSFGLKADMQQLAFLCVSGTATPGLLVPPS